MNKSFEIIDDKVIVTDEKRKTHTREISDNIEQILIVENNIEEIQKEIKKQREKIKSSERRLKVSSCDFFISALWLFNFSLNISLGNWIVAIGNLLCSSIWAAKGYFLTYKPEKKEIKAYNKYITTLMTELNEQNNKLKSLNNNKTNNAMCISPDKKGISTSEQIYNLKRKLILILVFEHNKRKFINYYKNNTLHKILLKHNIFDRNDIDFIQELIKNEITKKQIKNVVIKKVLKKLQ